VSAWADASGLVLGQVAVDSKAKEIVAIPHRLALLAAARTRPTTRPVRCVRPWGRAQLCDGAR
jgi:hypothetical protein